MDDQKTLTERVDALSELVKVLLAAIVENNEAAAAQIQRLIDGSDLKLEDGTFANKGAQEEFGPFLELLKVHRPGKASPPSG